MWEKWEAGEQPARISLGLLPSGPDPVGEHCACCQPPGRYMGRLAGNGNPAWLRARYARRLRVVRAPGGGSAPQGLSPSFHHPVHEVRKGLNPPLHTTRQLIPDPDKPTLEL